MKRIIFLAILIMMVTGCQSPTEEKTFTSFEKDYICDDCNIIFISIDTLRADHLGAYGYKKNTTPNIDHFSKDAVIFKNSISHAPSTEPSHASMMTSLIPSHHQALHAKNQSIPDKIVTMAELLDAKGYNTFANTGAGQVSSIYGFGRGFDTFKENLDHSFDLKVDSAIEWLSEDREGSFFIFLHTFETHHPYTPKKEYLELFETDYDGQLKGDVKVEQLKSINKGEIKLTKADKKHIINTYDAEIRSMDDAFAKLIHFLKEEKLYDNTIIIFTSDHGEEFGEHGWWGWHSHTLYDELLKVPLIIKFPDSQFSGMKIDDQVRGIDILPTVVDVLDIPPLEQFEGVNLLRLIKTDDNLDLMAISQRDGRQDFLLTSIRNPDSKLIKKEGVPKLGIYDFEFYDLIEDKTEQNNLYGSYEYKKTIKALNKKLTNALEKEFVTVESQAADLDDETIRELKALGYMG